MVKKDVGEVFVQIFDTVLGKWMGVPEVCVSLQKPAVGHCSLEHNGDMYTCDHFVYPEYFLGNIQERPMSEIVETSAARNFGELKRASLPAKCKQCKFLQLCNGGCPKHRFTYTENGEWGSLSVQ